MKKQSATDQSPIGQNTILTLTVPLAAHQEQYRQSLAALAAQVTVPGFRKGKAPHPLVEAQIGPSRIIDRVLEKLLPDIYARAVESAGISPLVQPRMEIKDLPTDGDWIIEAQTAVRPEVVLGDWKKAIKGAYKAHAKEHTHEESGETTPESVEQHLLSYTLQKLVQVVNPKIAPALVEQETRHQIEELAKQLASHRLELEAYLKTTGKTVESLQREYAASSLVSLQVEFVLQAVEDELAPEVSAAEISALFGESGEKLPEKTKKSLEGEAKRVIRRRKTLETIKALAQ